MESVKLQENLETERHGNKIGMAPTHPPSSPSTARTDSPDAGGVPRAARHGSVAGGGGGRDQHTR